MSDKETAPRIYAASRASVPERPRMWQSLRASGVNIVSSWIDEAMPGETTDLSELWVRIAAEVASADCLVLYVEPTDFPLKGAFIEVGIALALGKPVRVVTPGMEFDAPGYQPIGSWIKHPSVELFKDVKQACRVAVECRAPAPQPVESSAVDAKELIEISRVILRRLRLLPGDKLRLDLLAKMDIWLMEHTAAAPQVTEGNFCTGDQDCRHACELELEQEADGRWLAEFLRFTGVMAYGKSPEEAIRNAAKVLIEPCDHFWRTIPVNPRWSWFTECEKCNIGAPLELQAENYVEGSSPGTTKGTTKD